MVEKNAILITGGSMGNKGAQAMVFVAVSELAKRFPDKEIIMLSYNEDDDAGGYQYRFTMQKCTNETVMCAAGGIYRAMAKRWGSARIQKDADIVSLLKRAYMIIDVSGYGLTSAWGIYAVMCFLATARCAKRYGIPLYLMPQSFGPLDFCGRKRAICNLVARAEAGACLRHAKIIFAREKTGYAFLTNTLKLKNVRLANDMVLTAKPYAASNVMENYKQEDALDRYRGCVALIPNMRTFAHKDAAEIMELYVEIIERILKNNKKVLLMTHSKEDAQIVTQLKERFGDNDAVTACYKELLCFEFQQLVSTLDIVITSRYHSIVHAYKAATPCIVFGWADKYADLVSLFRQERFLFDVCDNIDLPEVLDALNELLENRSAQSHVIQEIYSSISKQTLFDEICAAQ